MTLEEIRSRKVKLVINTLKNANDRGLSIDYEKILNEISLEFGTARRKSMEYLDEAISYVGNTIIKITGIKEIIKRTICYDQIQRDNLKKYEEMTDKELKALEEGSYGV